MPFTITQFRSEISKQKNLARPNLFEVNVTGKAINNALVPFMAKIASIPNSTMGVVEVPYFGRQVKVPGNRTFDNLSITILNDENFSIPYFPGLSTGSDRFDNLVELVVIYRQIKASFW